MGNTIICGIDAHEKTLVTRIGANFAMKAYPLRTLL